MATKEKSRQAPGLIRSYYSAMSFPLRAEILAMGAREPVSASGVARILGKDLAATSYHFRVLTGRGRTRRESELTPLLELVETDKYRGGERRSYRTRKECVALLNADPHHKGESEADSLLDGITDLINQHGRTDPAKAVRAIAALSRSTGRDVAEVA